MGTPEFAIPALDLLVSKGKKPVLVITQPDKPQGRKRRLQSPPVKVCAQKHGIDVWQPENVNDQEILEQIELLKPDLIVTAAYGGYMGKKIRHIPSIAALNIHPSLLPKYRGASPVNASLFNGDDITGVSIFRLIARMDAGPVLYQSTYKIQDSDNYTSLLSALAIQGAEDLLKVIQQYETGTAKEVGQNEDEASSCSKLEKSDFMINWHSSAQQIRNKIRGLSEKPGAYIIFRANKIKIIRASVLDNKSELIPGTVIEIIKKQGIVISTATNDLLIEEVQPAGKKIMNAFDYNLGARINRGEKFFD